jgi:hypothetical protein
VCRLDAKRFAGHLLERAGVARGRPEFELGIAARPDVQQVIVAAIVELETGHDLRMTAVETLRETEDGPERPDCPPRFPFESSETFVPTLRCGLTMVPRDEADHFGLVRFEPAQLAVANQVVRMFVMPLVTDVDADIVQDGRVLEQLPLVIGQSVLGTRLVEQGDGEPGDVLRVFRPEVAPFGELEDAPPPDVRIPIGLRDFFPVPRDKVQDQSFAQREIAQRDVLCSEPAQDLVDENHAGNREVGAPGFETGHTQPLLEIERRQFLSQPSDLLRRQAAVSERAALRTAVGRHGHGAEAEYRA